MNPRTKFFRSMALLGVLSVGIVACEGDEITLPQTPSLTVSPATLSLTVGESQAVAAQLGGGLTGGVTFTSSNTAVASVSASGLVATVTGVSAGTATISVVSATNADVQASVGVVVTSATIPPSEGDPEITIASVTTGGTITPVNPANVTGQIDVTLDVQRGSADSLKVFLGGTAVSSCTQKFGASASASPITGASLQVSPSGNIVCSINTAAFDPATGAVTFPNGTVGLRAVLYDNGAEIEAASISELTLNNADTFDTDISFSGGSAVNPTTSLLWNSGDVTVTALPVMFSGRTVSQVTVTLAENDATPGDPPGGDIEINKTDTSAPFVVTFPADKTPAAGGVSGVEDILIAVVSSSIAGGVAGPDNVPATFPLPETAENVFRLDNADPVVTSFHLEQQNLVAGTAQQLCCSNSWVGAGYDFDEGLDGEADSGVGIGTIEFFVGPAGNTDAQILATTAVEGGSDLAETSVNTALRAIAVVTDLLGNETEVDLVANGTNGTTFGVDLTAPTLAFHSSSVDNMEIFNALTGAPGNFVVTFSDVATGGAGPSGFAPTPVLRRVLRVANDTPSCAAGTVISSVCQMSADDSTTPVTGTLAATTAGYYTYEGTVVDQGGNLSNAIAAPLSRLVLNDHAAPTLGGVTIPSTLTGGTAATFTVDADDNLNLHNANLLFRFAGVAGPTAAPEVLPFEGPAILNAQWPSPLTAASLLDEATVSRTITFIRSLEATTAGNAPTGAPQPTTDAVYRVRDAAFNEAEASNALTGVTAGGSFTADGVQTFAVTGPATQQNICNNAAGTGCGTTPAPTTRTVTITATGATGTFANPFTAVHLLRRENGAPAIVHYVGTAGSASVTDDGTTRTWTWTITFNAAGLPVQPDAGLFAVGVSSTGEALRTNDNINIDIIGT